MSVKQLMKEAVSTAQKANHREPFEAALLIEASAKLVKSIAGLMEVDFMIQTQQYWQQQAEQEQEFSLPGEAPLVGGKN